jgi:octaprenyl-diphosphate synthase
MPYGHAIMQVLADRHDLIAEDLSRVIQVFDAEIQSGISIVNELTERLRADRGKLLRPRLLLLSGRAAGRVRREHIVLAAVVEMVHLATLVHDDVLDEAEVRRSGPTAHCLVGNEGAVLLGDYLISHAYHLCSSLGSTDFSRRVASATNTVCEGELMQIAQRGNWTLSEEVYLEIIRRKTAALTGVCCELGAVASGARPDVVRGLAGFGVDLGMAFQIVDDLLDLSGCTDEAGKTLGRDAELGKLTLPAIRFLHRADPSSRRLLIDALSAGRRPNNDDVCAILRGSDAISDALDAARGYVASAIGRLGILPPSDAREALEAAAELIVQRRR